MAKQNPPDLRGGKLNNILAQQLTYPAKSLSINARTKNLEWMNKVEDAMAAETPQDVVSRLHNLRKELDAHTQNNPMASVAENADRDVAMNVRQTVDDILKNRVPGFSEGDAIYSQAHKAREAVDYGYNSLEGGKGAIFPESFNKQLSKQPKQFVIEGQKSRIANAMGTQSNDMIALRKLLGGDGDFNRAKLEATFGSQKVDDALKMVDGESQMSQNFADIVRNSKTAQSLEAAKLIPDGPRFKATGSETVNGTLVARPFVATLNYLAEKMAGKVNVATSEALSNSLTKKGNDLTKLLSDLSANKKVPLKDKTLIRALLISQAAQSSKATQQAPR
jgi:hypothetical protein